MHKNNIKILFILLFIFGFSSAMEHRLPEETHRLWVRQTLASLSLRKKIGQLVWPAVPCDPEQEGISDRLFTLNLPQGLDRAYAERMVQEYGVGGFLYICEGDVAAQVAFTNHLQSLSVVPLLFCQDCEPGLIRNPDLYRLPRQMTLGALHNRALIQAVGRVLGLRAQSMGNHIIFAPVADVNVNPKNPVINDRAFSENPQDVAERASALMEGIVEYVMPVGKHVPGHGDTAVDSHKGLPCIEHDRSRLEAVEFPPFWYLVAKGIPAFMTAHILFPHLDPLYPATLSRSITRDIVRGQWGFEGLIFTDALVMEALTKHYHDANVAVAAFQAGNSVLLFSADVPAAIAAIEAAVKKGSISLEDLDARVSDILMAKARAGLCQEWHVREENILERLNSEGVRTLKRRLYHEAITLVKNDGVFPVADPEQTVIVQVGVGPSDTFIQMMRAAGCHTINISANPDEQAIRHLVSTVSGYGHVIFALFGMNKFASKSFGLSQKAIELTKQYFEGKRISVVLFGNPYALKFFGSQEGIIECYEDDEDAQEGAALVMLGRLDARGRLPITASEQFPYGAGL